MIQKNIKFSYNPLDKNTKKFLNKFEGRTEEIGIGGAKEIVKSSIITVNSKNKNDLPNLKSEKTNKKFSYNEMMFEYNKLNYNDIKNLEKKRDLSEEYPNIVKISPNENINEKRKSNKDRYANLHEIFNNDKNELIPEVKTIDYNKENYFNNGRLYKPRKFKDYLKMMEAYKKNRFGSLGPNIRTKAWNEKFDKMEKIKKFSDKASLNNILKIKELKSKINENKNNGNSYKNKRIQRYIALSPTEMEYNRKQYEINNSKFHRIQKYGKGVMLNKVRVKLNELKQKQIEEEKLRKQRELENSFKSKDFVETYNNDIQDNKKEDYLENLLKLKAAFINFT